MNYVCYSCGKDRGPYEVVSDIKGAQVNAIKEALVYLKGIAIGMDYWSLIEYNISQLHTTLSNHAFEQEDAFIYANSAFSNFLSAFYLWKCHNNHLKKNFLQEMLNTCSEKYVVNCLIGELRNYITHNGFIIKKISFDVLNEKTYYKISPKDVLTGMKEKGNSRLKNYLRNLIEAHEDIYVQDVLDNFSHIFPEVQKKIWADSASSVHNSLKILLEVVPDSNPDLYNSYIISEDGEDYINTGHTLYHFIRKAQKYYPDYLTI